MQQQIAHIALVVKDYDEAIDFYVNQLKFVLVEDKILSPSKRWVLVRPPGNSHTCLLLARASGKIQESRIGNQTGGRVFLFLHTDDFDRDFQNLLNQKIRIVRPPSKEEYGRVTVFEDLYGNLWDLVERNSDR